jgi:hypothetical protein
MLIGILSLTFAGRAVKEKFLDRSKAKPATGRFPSGAALPAKLKTRIAPGHSGSRWRAILADFGFLREVGRGRRETVLYRPTDGAIVYLAYDLYFGGSTDAGLIRHRDWRLFGMRERDVITAMDRLTAEGWWLLQAAGSVVRITWKFRSMQEVVDALAG